MANLSNKKFQTIAISNLWRLTPRSGQCLFFSCLSFFFLWFQMIRTTLLTVCCPSIRSWGCEDRFRWASYLCRASFSRYLNESVALTVCESPSSPAVVERRYSGSWVVQCFSGGCSGGVVWWVVFLRWPAAKWGAWRCAAVGSNRWRCKFRFVIYKTCDWGFLWKKAVWVQNLVGVSIPVHG